MVRRIADNAFTWASSRGLVRTNEMHGEDEAKLVLGQAFSIVQEEGERTERTSSIVTEASCLIGRGVIFN